MMKNKIGNIEFWRGSCGDRIFYIQRYIKDKHYSVFSWFCPNVDKKLGKESDCTIMPHGDKIIIKAEELKNLMDIRELPKMLISRN